MYSSQTTASVTPKIFTMEQRLRRKISDLLVVTAAFFAPFGSGIGQMMGVDVSKIFVAVALLLIIYWLVFIRHKLRPFPLYFKLFIFFVTLHIFIVYVLIFPEELQFGYVDKILIEGGLIRAIEFKGNTIARFCLFVLFGFALACLIRSEKQLIGLSLGYGTGLAIVITLGGYSILTSGSEIRFGGGFLNPDPFGFSGAMSVCLNTIILTLPRVRTPIKIFSVVFIMFGIVGVILSGTRAAILGLCIFVLVLLIYVPSFKRKLQCAVCILVLGVAALIFVNRNSLEVLKSRVSIERALVGGGAGRLYAWADYLKKIQDYGLTGVGMGHSEEVIKDSWTYRWASPHNNYLSTFVQFGAIGLLLYFAGLWQLWKRVYARKLKIAREVTGSAFLAFYCSVLTMLFFGDYYGSRDLWIFFGVIAAYGSGNIKTKRVKAAKNLAWVKDSRCVESPA